MVGSASFHVSGETAWMRGALVAQRARGRGIQRALIAARARAAEEFGCNLVGACGRAWLVSARNLRAVRDAALGHALELHLRPKVNSNLIVERTGPNSSVARVRLNRPEVHNAFNAELIVELPTLFKRFSDEPANSCARSFWPAKGRRSVPART